MLWITLIIAFLLKHSETRSTKKPFVHVDYLYTRPPKTPQPTTPEPRDYLKQNFRVDNPRALPTQASRPAPIPPGGNLQNLQNPLPHSMREPIIFEPKTQIHASGGTYEMALVYQTEPALAESRRIVAYIQETQRHYNLVWDQWHDIHGTVNEDGNPDFPQPLHTRSSSLPGRKKSVVIQEVHSDLIGRQMAALGFAHQPLARESDGLVAQLNSVVESISHHGHTTHAHYSPSSNPYARAQAKRRRKRSAKLLKTLLQQNSPDVEQLLAVDQLSPAQRK